MTDEEPLEGGNSNPTVVRVGDTVRRAASSSTATVHTVLNHLANRSYPAPRALGIDGQGREILTFIPGECVHPNNLDLLATDESMNRIGRLIFEYHEAQADYTAPPGADWRSEGRDPTGSTEVIAHNDLAPWNLVAGPGGWTFIDWDLVAPGRRFWDLAWALHSFVGLWPESELSDDQTARRIGAFCGGARVAKQDRGQLIDVVIERTLDHTSMLQAKASNGDVAYVHLVEEGHADRWRQASDHVARNRDRWLHLLDRSA